MIPLIVGTALALAALSFVLYPLLFGSSSENQVIPSASQRESTGDSAIDALREIEFDRETGKLSDLDYAALKASYTQRAVNAMRAGASAVCDRCGPRPESDARFCSSCGAPLYSAVASAAS